MKKKYQHFTKIISKAKKSIDKNDKNKLDIGLLFSVVILVLIGMIMVFSSSVIMADIRYQAPYHFIINQLKWTFIGAFAMYFMYLTDFRKLQRLSYPLLVISVILLILVLFVGVEKGCAKRWLQFGPISFQPSELTKLIMVIFVADYIDRKKSRIKKFSGLSVILGVLGVLCVLIGLQPDLGTPTVIAVVVIFLLYSAGARATHLGMVMLVMFSVFVMEIIHKPYRLIRVKDYFQSLFDLQSGSYQLSQSILALGSGGIFGKGLAQSKMKLMYLPEPHTDFILPIIGEELGFVGVITVLSIFCYIGWRGWRISTSAQNLFGEILAIGITWLIIFQALVNVGVACGLFPTKGLPLPFVSFGGTALVLNMIEIGILLNIYKRGK